MVLELLPLRLPICTMSIFKVHGEKVKSGQKRVCKVLCWPGTARESRLPFWDGFIIALKGFAFARIFLTSSMSP